MVLVGNKCDLADGRVITREQAEELAESLGVQYFEASAKDDIEVRPTFESLVDSISLKMVESIESNPAFKPQKLRSRDSEPGNNGVGGCGAC